MVDTSHNLRLIINGQQSVFNKVKCIIMDVKSMIRRLIEGVSSVSASLTLKRFLSHMTSPVFYLIIFESEKKRV